MDLTTQKDADASNTSEAWTLQVDRGGLWYVKNNKFTVYCKWGGNQECLKSGSCHKSTIIKNVVGSKELEFYWLIAQADFNVGDEDTYQILLHKIVERYKQSTSKGKNELKRSVENFMMTNNFSSIL